MRRQIMQRLIGFAAVAAATITFSSTAPAQERDWHEISVQASGVVTRNSQGNDIVRHTTDSGGILINYRFHLNNWLAAEANYGYNRNTHQFFTSGGPFGVQANAHQTTGALVVTLPSAVNRAEPYILGGVGALTFDPRFSDLGTIGAPRQQTRPAFVYGLGSNFNLTPNLALRLEYRGLVYRSPDFGMTMLNSRTTTHTAVPSVGFTVRF
jgi:opacity protein-like surface antigen